jgi:DNA-binding NarL/FixJ family response regulator
VSDSVRVLIVDDHAILRDGIRSLLERQEGLIVVGEAANGQQALEMVETLHPQVVLMDIAMPTMDGLAATRHIHASHPEVRVLILTQHDNREYIAPALQAGASGYVLKRSGGQEVVNAIREVVAGRSFIEADVAQQIVRGLTPDGDNGEPALQLTEREQQVLRRVVKGLSNKEIARELVISPKTASVHRSNIMSKLGVRNSADLVRYAIQHKLIEEEPS